MQTVILAVIIGLTGGVAVGLQAPLTSLMSQRIGTLESIFIIHFGGAVLTMVLLLTIGGGNLGSWRNVPWYALGAGSLGLVILAAISYTIPRLGVATTVTLVVTAQFLVAALLDNFGALGTSVRPVDLSRLIGMAVLFLGTWLMVRS
ncbi:MAG: DMT family transporter [Deltaproteobacteria bacterium]|nr:DMT family transporter [Deltaproteobacteria bacterium]MCD6139012.1 DMT family transporter [Deltaproteobacteria bacterium]RLB89776.1 MAG: EamA-like transporter family protein [Deltaproteobacteria bacterium]RLB89838.1 MAG: EamA-like transporter family protein [Deltaproteobacteria bacterium]RLC08315.1 MAG: EamA-like transporter family protein [Deltaproteobacteria bacterium]